MPFQKDTQNITPLLLTVVSMQPLKITILVDKIIEDEIIEEYDLNDTYKATTLLPSDVGA